ncbi:hypothetical protein acdb102_06590 [Acidothermaceae bacterium B102]|nr:hypothetical protein acdb102_06590 [Acidothermaceae bacterium B102]
MIQNVVMGKLKPGLELSAAQPALDAILALTPPGLIECRVGTDLRLREGSWDYAISSTWVDEAAYRAYDLDDEHNRIRRELFAPVSEQISRVQFEA